MAITDNHWSPQETLNNRRITSTDVSPDENRIVFTVNQAVITPEKDSFLAQIHLAVTDGTPPRQLTKG